MFHRPQVIPQGSQSLRLQRSTVVRVVAVEQTPRGAAQVRLTTRVRVRMTQARPRVTQVEGIRAVVETVVAVEENEHG